MKTLAGLLIIPLLAACAAGAGGSPSDGSTPRDSTPPSESTSAAAPDGIPQEVWQAILADVQDRAGTPLGEVSVLVAQPETWNDGSLGCPKDGEMYTQALVDGYQVVVEVAGTEYDYRVGSGTDVRLCENPPAGS